jgi:hypothetical protein
MGKIFFPIGAIATLILAIVDANPWKLFMTLIFVMMSIQAFKEEPREQSEES